MATLPIPAFTPQPVPDGVPAWDYLVGRYMAGRNFSQPPTAMGHVPVAEMLPGDEDGAIDRLARLAVLAWLTYTEVESHVWWLSVHRQPVGPDLLAIQDRDRDRYKVALEAWRTARFAKAMFGGGENFLRGKQEPRRKAVKAAKAPSRAADPFDDFG